MHLTLTLSSLVFGAQINMQPKSTNLTAGVEMSGEGNTHGYCHDSSKHIVQLAMITAQCVLIWRKTASIVK